MQQMNNGQLPNNSFGFLFEFPKIILSLNDISNLMTTQYQQIQNNFEILFSLSNNFLYNSQHKNNCKKLSFKEKLNSDEIKQISYDINIKNNINKKKPHFKVLDESKIIKRKCQSDCLTKKLNLNFFKFIKENKKELNIDKSVLYFLKKHLKLTSKSIFEQLKTICPKINEFFDKFLKSNVFKKLMDNIKKKYDREYSNLFFNHITNFQKLLNEKNETKSKIDNLEIN